MAKPVARRIVSLLPSATEMVFALGLGDELVGVTHECDYPITARSRHSVVRNALPIESMSQHEIDVAVTQRLRDGLSIYELDDALIERLAPDLIITQSLCDVCAPSGNDLARLLTQLSTKPEILWMTPHSLAEIEDNIRDLGCATGRDAAATSLIEGGRQRIAHLAETVKRAPNRPRVFCMEWLDPVYCSGHWVPEMVEIAGGIDALGRKGTDSVRIQWQDVLDWAPEVLVIMPCGYSLGAAFERARGLFDMPGYASLPALRDNRAYVVDANSYFARPGPRVVEGTELLAHLFHPDVVDWTGPSDAYCRLTMNAGDKAVPVRGLAHVG